MFKTIFLQYLAFWTHFRTVRSYLMLFGVGISCRILYSIVSCLYLNCSRSITSVGEETANCLLSFACDHVVPGRKGFLFLWVLGVGCFILLWHSLRLPYNYFEQISVYEISFQLNNPYTTENIQNESNGKRETSLKI